MGQDSAGAMSYFHTDGLNSVRQLTDGTGTLTYAANFDPYGSVLSQNSLGGSSNLGYTGAPSDPSGLVYLNARFYNPSLGSFLTHDPLEGSVSNPSSFNGYGYAGGNPATYIDPSGQCDEQYRSHLGLCALQDVAIVGNGINTFFGYVPVGAQAFGYGVTHHPDAVIAGAFEGFASQVLIPPIAIITSLGSQVFNRLMGKAPASIQEISDYLSRTSRQGLERIVGHQFDELSFLAGNVPGQAGGIAFNVATAVGGFSNLASGLGGAADLLGESLSFQTQTSGAIAIAGVSTIGLGAALGQAAVGAGELAFGGVNFFAAKGSGGGNPNSRQNVYNR